MAAPMPRVVNVDLQAGIVHMEDGEVLPIIRMVDYEGRDCDDPDDAAAFVAGRDDYGYVEGEVYYLDGDETVH